MNEDINISGLQKAITSTGEVFYFIGIGGIGMSAVARYFYAKGCRVSGYDKTPTVLTTQLEKEGIKIHYNEDIELIPKDANVVVYTPAVPLNHAELVYYKEHGYSVIKRSDVLKLITENSFNICVAGTHGKTTVSTMIAYILRHSDFGCNAFLGGISANYGTNFWSSQINVCVVEADEYDRSFLKLFPNVAVITSMDPDHLDIYGTAEEVEKAFVSFSKNVKEKGCLITKYGLKADNEFLADKQYRYSLDNDLADVYAKNIVISNGSYVFDVIAKEWEVKNILMHMGGLHNIENMVAAIAVAKYLKIEDEKIRKAVEDFKGVKRRFEYVLKNEKHVVIDDYAHHPEELRALINGVKNLFAQKIVMVFQPHLYSRTKDQADGFAEVLSLCDEVILLDIYPARELPMQGVLSEMIVERMEKGKAKVMSKVDMCEWVKSNKPSLIVMAGAGDIDVQVGKVVEILETV